MCGGGGGGLREMAGKFTLLSTANLQCSNIDVRLFECIMM